MKRAARSALTGYAGGLATAGVIVVLSLGAMRGDGELAPNPEPTTLSTSVPLWKPPASVSQHSVTLLSAEARGWIAPLEARLAIDPGDLSARKQLAAILLQNQQLMVAYEHASAILEADGDDPDGLYVHAVVRLAMGQASPAIELLDRVLARYPNHVLALDARAEAQRKIGDASGAAITAARARQAARASEGKALLTPESDPTPIKMMRGAQKASSASPSTTSGR